ncbi:hypothetical protein [Methanobacterium sp.]|uniref:hypothetical protein n=1 Tax=Methanobacterium sp. TaxID=2164 RepID=UPI003C778956
MCEQEVNRTFKYIEETINGLIEHNGGSVKGKFEEISNLDYFKDKKCISNLNQKIKTLREELDRDPKISRQQIVTSREQYFFYIKVNKSYKDHESILSPEEQEKWKKEALESIKIKFKRFEEEGSKYIASYKHILDDPRAKDLINNEFIPSQNKWQIRNGAQYKLVEEKEPGKAHKSTLETKKEELRKFNFDINIVKMFYEVWNDSNLKQFLIEAHKVPINKKMVFIPIKLENKNNYYYVLFIDNEIEDLSLFRIKNLRYINDQSNLFNLVKSLLPHEIAYKQESYFIFLKLFSNELCKYVLTNEKILRSFYEDLDDFYKDKQILKQFKYEFQKK